MKKYILTTLIVLNFIALPSYSATIMRVIALEEFNTVAPSETISFKLKKDCTLGDYEFKSGDVINCNVSKVVQPKRGKRNAKFYVEPSTYISDEEEKQIETKLKGKYIKGVFSKEEIKQLNKGEIAMNAAMKAGSAYIKTVVPGYSVVKGMILNEEGNVVKSGIKGAYKDSPLVFFERGKEIYLEPDDEFSLLFSKPKQEKKQKDKVEEPVNETEIPIEDTEEI